MDINVNDENMTIPNKMKKLTRLCPRTMTGKHYFVYQYDLWMNERELDKPKECKYCGIIDDRKE